MCGRATTTELGRCGGGGGAVASWRQRSAVDTRAAAWCSRHHARAAALRRSSAGALSLVVEREGKFIIKRGVMAEWEIGDDGQRRLLFAARRALPRSR